MAKTSKRKKKRPLYEDTDLVVEPRLSRWFGADSEHIVFAAISLLAALFFGLAALDTAGLLGRYAHTAARAAFGANFPILPLSLIIIGISFLKNHRPVRIVGVAGVIFFLAASSIGPLLVPLGESGTASGAIANALTSLLGSYISVALLGLVIVFSLATLVDLNLAELAAAIRARYSGLRAEDDSSNDTEATYTVYSADQLAEADKTLATHAPSENASTITGDPSPEETERGGNTDTEAEFSPSSSRRLRARSFETYSPPPLSILEKDSGKPGVGDIKANANLIKRTLANFGINVEMDEVSIGPAITRYALKPAEGVKLSRIVNLQDNLALALAAHPLRIEAPIPGKSLVGIEIPNTTRTTVGLGTLLAHRDFEASPRILPFALGRGISGNVFFGDLCSAPHLLIAGATGSGKSVSIHCIISSFLYRYGPQDLRFIMIDPKRVELTLYNHIPHLLSPVITDPKKAILSLKWAAKEMERRYDILESHAVRDLKSYRQTVVEPALKKNGGADGPEPLPYIVIVIDELADLMVAYPRELEAAVVRLAQKSRAVGIHLLISTQRPSVEVITGLIKANIPARIALQVPSQIDSRTILDMSGAEKLLGAGDMLYLAADMAKPQRIQSAYLSESEVKRIVEHIKKNTAPPGDSLGFAGSEDSANEQTESIDLSGDSDKDNDDLYHEARGLVIEAGKASTSYLQRRLKVGYARAARLIDMLEERGVVGPGEGSKPREVYTSTSDTTTTTEDSVDKEVSV